MIFVRNIAFIIIAGLLWMVFDIINQNNTNTKIKDYTMITKSFDLARQKNDFVYKEADE